MNKSIKRIVSIGLAIGFISAVVPETNINLLTMKAYAADENGEHYLDSLSLSDEDGEQIKTYSTNEYKDKVDEDDIEESKTYYAKSPSKVVSVSIEGPSDDYVKVFSGSSSNAKGIATGDDVDLSEDSQDTTITVKVFGKKPPDDIKYKDCNDYNVLSTYRIRVENAGYNKDNNDGNIYLARLSVNNNMIDLSKSKDEYTYNVDSDVSQVTLRATPEDDDYDVTIDNKAIFSADNYKKTINLDKGRNEFEIKLEDGSKEKTYTLVINRGTPSSTSTSKTNTTNEKDPKDYANIYLDKLTLDGKVVPLSQSKVNYSYNVPDYIKEVAVKAEPEKDYYTVTVNGYDVGGVDNYKKTVKLDKGENVIKIELQNKSHEERVYTLVVTRGEASSVNNTTQSTENNVTEVQTYKWIQVNGAWKCNDASGNPVKNAWAQNYYLKDDGTMATGWLSINGAWYYFGIDGAKKTGWQSAGGKWYYLDSEGKMQTGWIKDVIGRSYYLNTDGSMAYNTTIGGYKIGMDGSCTEK